MDPFLMKSLAAIFVALFVGKRAITGPQKMFARISVCFEVVGMATLATATQKDDLAANVGGILLMIGLVVAIAMVAVDCVYTVCTARPKRNP